MNSRGRAADRHIPVLRDRIVDLLAPALTEPGSVYVDATLGMGGHARGRPRTLPEARLVGIDRDQEALALAGERLEPYAARVTLVHAVYDEFADVVHDLGLPEVARRPVRPRRLLAAARRGRPRVRLQPRRALDMRMDQSRGLTAADVLNTYEAAELERILREYGEERFARKIAAAIVRERAREPFTTSARLVDLLKKTVPAASQKSGGHPGKRTFQALRIEVNAELSAWATALPAAIETLAVGGRIAVLSYHSLEDRITKRVFAAGARSSSPEGLPVELPSTRHTCVCSPAGPRSPAAQEQAANPRSASARLRAAERTAPPKGQHR